MTAQEPLWQPPVWTDAYSPGDRVSSQWTNNRGTVVTVVTGRHLLIRWDRWRFEDDAYTARHSSPQGLVREVEA